MKICIVTTSFKMHFQSTTGGIVYELAKAFREKGLEIYTVAPHAPQLKEREIMDGIFVYRFRYAYPSKIEKIAYIGSGIPTTLKKNLIAKLEFPFFLLSFIYTTIKISKYCDIIHAQWVLSGLIAIISKYLNRKPLVITCRGSDVRGQNTKLLKLIFDRADALISPHPEITQILKKTNTKTPIYEINNFINLQKYHPGQISLRLFQEFQINSNTKIITFVGYFSDIKDPLTFIYSIEEVIKNIPQIKYLLVGDGILRSSIEKYIKQNNLQNFIILAGARDDVPDILRITTIFVALSPIENVWSNALLEAIATKVPCIITDAGHSKKIFKDRINAYIIPPKNPKALANAIIELIQDQNMRINISNNAYKDFIPLFDKNNIINRHLEIFNDLLKK